MLRVIVLVLVDSYWWVVMVVHGGVKGMAMGYWAVMVRLWCDKERVDGGLDLKVWCWLMIVSDCSLI